MGLARYQEAAIGDIEDGLALFRDCFFRVREYCVLLPIVPSGRPSSITFRLRPASRRIILGDIIFLDDYICLLDIIIVSIIISLEKSSPALQQVPAEFDVIILIQKSVVPFLSAWFA